MISTNPTLNVCLTHRALESSLEQHADLIVAPHLVHCDGRLAVVPDEDYNPFGQSLSEYAQLLWIHANIGALLGDKKFIRIFHYRRFISLDKPAVGVPSTNQPWAQTITPDLLPNFHASFSKSQAIEILNRPVILKNGVMGQYGNVHHLEDMFGFMQFLISEKILTTKLALKFSKETKFIPACNIGCFSRSTFDNVFNVLRAAAQYRASSSFKARDGYQRRNMGFLLERLQSFLLLEHFRGCGVNPRHGYNLILSPTPEVSSTIYI